MKERVKAEPARQAATTGCQSLMEQSVATLRGVGPRVGECLNRLGVQSVGDLLCLLPIRYEDRTQVRPIGGLSPGERVLISGAVELAEVVYRRRRSMLCRISDSTGNLTLRFFHFSKAQHDALSRGTRLRCFGEVRLGPTGLEMVHPEYTLIESAESLSEVLTPVYPATEGLHQQRIRGLIRQALTLLEREPLADVLAPLLSNAYPGLDKAIRLLHAPPVTEEAQLLVDGRHPCQRRLALEELIAQRLSLLQIGRDRQIERSPALAGDGDLLPRFLSHLGFELTRAQRKALQEVLDDLRAATPMHRLLQGDVGSGKTVVSAAAALVAVSSGHQAAVMVPTELLAEQHLRSFDAWLSPLGVAATCLTSSLTTAARNERYHRIERGEVGVVIGTHALFQEAVRFKSLALVVVDEQHRFGVHQRLALMLKGRHGRRMPHQLVMTATPIPRTLAMTAYADLDCSVIDELPRGRQPVRTAAIPQSRRADIVRRVEAHCRGGHQAYWVCPLIEESDAIDSQAAEKLFEDLQAALPALRVGLLHGRMRATEKDRVMRAFKEGALDLLVATTVVEVGVDVPKATLMVIENSERMGLAQLHQLRGRVGRGSEASSCVLLYKPPLSALARERLGVMRETTDGFRVAQKDMELRGPGEVLGTRQTGLMQLKIADLIRDADLLPQVIELSDSLLETSPAHAEALVRRWNTGQMRYAKV